MRNTFFLLGLLSLPGLAEAQVFNNGVFYVGSGTTYYCNGNFTNTVNGTYQNDGVMYISGNISNDQAGMPAGAGTTYFNGTAAQLLNGAAAFRVENLTLNNAAGMTLNNRLAIGDGTTGSLTFTSGLITSGTSTQDVYFYPGSSYTGFDASHHIIGYVTKSGNTDFTFPIGNGTYQTDVDLAGLSGTADFQVLYNGSGYGSYATDASLPGGVFDKEWWDIHEATGSASAQVTLKWNDARALLNHTMPSGLVVAHFNSGVWQSVGGTSSNAPTDAVGSVGPSNSLSNFSPFTFGSISVSLPIILSSFTVTENNCQAALAWTTSIEQNDAGFDVQESTDGTNYITVAYVKAKGVPSSYGITIAQAAAQAFYRLRLVDLDGQSTYSTVDALQLSCMAVNDDLSVYPNPVPVGMAIGVKLVSSSAKGAAQLQAFDMKGNKVYSALVEVNSGTNFYQLPAGGLPQGMYTIFVVGDGWKMGGTKLVK